MGMPLTLVSFPVHLLLSKEQMWDDLTTCRCNYPLSSPHTHIQRDLELQELGGGDQEEGDEEEGKAGFIKPRSGSDGDSGVLVTGDGVTIGIMSLCKTLKA